MNFEFDGGDESCAKFLSSVAISQLHAAMGISHVAELSSRVNRMESSTRNAAEMLEKLKVVYNRSRQAQITNELMEVISGASATV